MPAPTLSNEFLGCVRRSGLIDEATLNKLIQQGKLPDDPSACANALVRAGHLSEFQAQQLLKGRFRGFVLGPYKLLRPLGEGGMGIVYQGEHTLMRRQVAIKVLPQDKALDRLALERFYREARSAAALDHANIVRFYDVAQGAGVHFLVMEYVDGTNLQDLIDKTGPMHHAQVAEYIGQVAAGLAHAHDKGFVHRDIKPANLIVNRQGVVKILDMGLTRSVEDPNDQLTAVGGMDAAGTADFLSPEQALNMEVDARSDIYSLGATMFTLMTGTVPFEGTTAQKLLQHQVKEPPALHTLRASVPPALGDVVAKMMAKEPDDRYQSADELIDALRPWLPAPVRPSSVIGRKLTEPETGVRSPVTRKMTRPLPRQRKAAETETATERESWFSRNKWVAALPGGLGVLAVLVWAFSGPGEKTAPDTANADAGTATPAAPAATPPGPDRRVYATNFSALTPFRFTFQDGEAGDPDWRNKVPPGLYLHCWKPTSAAEFRATQDGTRFPLGVTNLNDDISSQIVFQFDETPSVPPTKPGQMYRLKYEYRTLNDATGVLSVRNPHNNTYPTFASGQLTSTNGEWRWAEVTFRRPEVGKLDAIVDNRSVGEGNTIEFRALELFETSGR